MLKHHLSNPCTEPAEVSVLQFFTSKMCQHDRVIIGIEVTGIDIYAEFLPALIIPNEQRITSFPKTSRSGLSINFSSISRTRVIAYC